MAIHSFIVSPIKPAVFALFGLIAVACAHAPSKVTATIPKVDISALPFTVQPLAPVNPADAAMRPDAAGLESIEQSSLTAATPMVSEDVPIETSTDTADDHPLPPSLNSLPKLAVSEQMSAQPGNITEPAAETVAEPAAETAAETVAETAAETVAETAAETAAEPIPAVVAAEQAQPTAMPDTATESTQAPETLTVIDDIAADSGAEKTSTASVEVLPPGPISSPPASSQNVSGQNTSGQKATSFAGSAYDSAYDGCKIIRIYGNYISVSITRNGTEALLVSLDLPKEYNDLQTMVNYIAYSDFEPASYYPYEDETPSKIAELIRNGNVQCVLQAS